MSSFTITPPSDYSLARDVCSYGYFLLAPNRWNVKDQSLSRALLLEKDIVGIVISQPKGRDKSLRVGTDRAISKTQTALAEEQIRRMLRLDEDESHVREFHKVDPRWKRTGRARLFRSPSLFEDVLKTVTSCNVTWPGTVHMNRRLCEVVGRSSPSGLLTFPTAAALSRTRPETLRSRCRVGYRDLRIIELSRMFAKRDLEVRIIEDASTPDELLHETLLSLPGVGPYAAANIMQLLGRYSRLPLDTESVRHGRSVLGYTGSSKQIMRRVKDHFAPFESHAFRSYWFEMWVHYEKLQGPANTWDRDTTGTMFTASQLEKLAEAAGHKPPSKPVSKPPKAAKSARRALRSQTARK
ncbi:MAG: DNA-3-methyladenine glycosylase family protein [Phycisphaerales bacterium]